MVDALNALCPQKCWQIQQKSGHLRKTVGKVENGLKLVDWTNTETSSSLTKVADSGWFTYVF